MSTETYSDEDYFTEQPNWFSADKIALSIAEDTSENEDKMPLVTMLQRAKQLKKGDIIELVTSFVPAPGIEVLKSKGFSAWTRREGGDQIKSYFLKNTDCPLCLYSSETLR